MSYFSKSRLIIVMMIVAVVVGAVGAQDFPPIWDELPDPQPYPEGVAIGGTEAKTFALDEILYYGALDSYNEPDWIAEMVAAGDLPPVEERLPENPQVILEGFMSTGIGEYGGLWRDFSSWPGYDEAALEGAA